MIIDKPLQEILIEALTSKIIEINGLLEEAMLKGNKDLENYLRKRMHAFAISFKKLRSI